MSPRVRLGVFGVGAVGLGALLLWAIAGLPDFGHYPGPYGTILNRVALPERHASNVVVSVVFDYRGFDTLGEELILFAAVLGVALVLRSSREEEAKRVVDPIRSDAVRALGARLVVPFFALGLFTVANGLVTPGGGFQGGVVAGVSLVLLYLAVDHRSFRALTPTPAVDFLEGLGAAAFVAMGIATLVTGSAFLHNFLPLDKIGLLTSGGSIGLLNWAAGLEVGAAFVLLFAEFLESLELQRKDA